MRTSVRILAILIAAAFSVGLVLAHGDKVHVIGTVEKTTADSVTVKTKEGKSVEVKLVAATMYVMVGADKVAKPAKLSDLAVGEHVVIHATPKGETLEAAEVRFSAVGAPAASGSKP